jgi:hypothetical protein
MTETALPGNVGTGTVTGTLAYFQKAAGTGTTVQVPASGTVTFTPSAARVIDVAVQKVFIGKPVQVSLDSAGHFQVDLVATNDPDLNPNGFTYQVSFALTGTKVDTFNMAVPEGQTTDLSAVVPVSAAMGVPILRGVGVPDPTTATAGDAVVFNGTAVVWAPVASGGGGGGAVASVNGQTGVVVITAGSLGALTDASIGTQVPSLIAGKIPTSQIPSLTISNPFVVASQSAMLALAADAGDVAIRTDTGANYILVATPASTLAKSLAQLTPGASFKVYKVGANWKFPGSTGATITARPTARTDLTMESVSTDGSVPTFAIADLDMASTVGA